MRKINVLEFISLDGVIDAPGGPEEDTSGAAVVDTSIFATLFLERP